MLRVLTTLLICAGAQAATLSVNLAVTATAAISTNISVTGTATLTGGISDKGTFSATAPASALTGANVTAPYTMTLASGTMGGNLTFPISLLTGSGAVTVTVTSATGSYAGDTGTLSLNGSGSIGSTGAITLTFSGSGTITTGGTVTAPPPTITAVLDAGSNTPNLGQGGYFIVKGSNLAGSTLNAQSLPFPTSAGGVTITFTPTTGGSGTQVYIYYTLATQLAGIVPSTLAPGNYNVTVTYNNNASSGFPTTVVASKPAFFTQDQTGGGLVVAQNIVSATQYDLNRLTTGSVNGVSISPGKPGQGMVAYGTGLGPVPGGDNVASAGYDFTQHGVNVQVLVGGMSMAALYAGRTPGFAGLDQISFILPQNVPTGCAVVFQISVNGVLSPATTLSIAPSAAATACVLAGFTTAQLQQLDQGGTYTQGGFNLEQLTETLSSLGTVKFDTANGSFSQYTGFELGALASSSTFTSNTIGACTVYQSTTTSSGVSAGGGATYLDAGSVTLNGPSGTNLSNTPMTETLNTYSLTIGEEGITLPGSLNGKIVAGTYTLNGAGGKDVKAFGPVSITLGSPLTITGGLPSTVTESAGLTLNWTGGNASDVVEIIGGTSSSTGTGSNTVTTSTAFICTTTAGPGTFNVPASVLTQVPKTTSSTNGSLEVLSTPTPVPFTAPLTAGGSINATFSALVGSFVQVAYQ